MSVDGSETGDFSARLRERVLDALATRERLEIVGSGSKRFYGRRVTATPLDVSHHVGIVEYEPSELVLTARCGTPLTVIEAELAGNDQMLAFEPPHFGAGATLGGTVACGLSGPRRPFAGAVRDFVLGVKLLNGRGEILSFGGRVMKNVAGFDVSRLMAGALGTLGLVLEVSLKVLPKPEQEVTLRFEADLPDALARMNDWAGRGWPLSAACHDGTFLRVRLAGAEDSIAWARAHLGGESEGDGGFWADLREQRAAFFQGPGALWRLSVPPALPMPELPGIWLVDWGGALRWLRTECDAGAVFAAAARLGGHATLFRPGNGTPDAVFHPLPPALLNVHRQIKKAFDPAGIFNRGRLYDDL